MLFLIYSMPWSVSSQTEIFFEKQSSVFHRLGSPAFRFIPILHRDAHSNQV